MKNFGKRGTDKITGFSGVITAKCDYMYGCAQYLLTPTDLDKEKKLIEGHWFDIGRVQIGKEIINPESVQSEAPGGENREHPN